MRHNSVYIIVLLFVFSLLPINYAEWSPEYDVAPISDDDHENLRRNDMLLQFYSHRFTKAFFNEKCGLDSVMLIPIYYWSDSTVEMFCYSCDEVGVVNGLVKIWRYLPFTPENMKEVNYGDYKKYEDVKSMKKNFDSAYDSLFDDSRMYRPRANFYQNDGKLYILRAGLETQGFYNCYDEESKDAISWVYVAIAMAPTIAMPERVFWNDPDTVFSKMLTCQTAAGSDMMYQTYGGKSVRHPMQSAKQMDKWPNYLDMATRLFWYVLTANGNLTKNWDKLHSWTNVYAELNNMFAVKEHVVIPFEPWHYFFRPAPDPPDEMMGNLLTDVDGNFAIDLLWSSWSACPSCNAYVGIRRREAHCYLRKLRPFDPIGTLWPSLEKHFCDKFCFPRVLQERHIFGKSRETAYAKPSGVHHLKGFSNLDDLLSKPEFTNGIRLHSGLLVDAFCGSGHGRFDCDCMNQIGIQSFHMVGLFNALLGKAKSRYEKFGGVVPCFDYIMMEEAGKAPVKIDSKCYDYSNKRVAYACNREYEKPNIYGFTGGYYIQVEQCTSKCEHFD
ncbi:Uncharacterized protein T4B_7297 [Trichinella pseudospiralis]|uniref:Uncharacterized protein n=2 Tax=Trichinella pseudospiralis TaxID=6337 RepID=A0A0V1IU03_TRIPS|nr:Uncharacterized protein T4E_6600 [Trichinella pseudospiralis]KRY74697.1 Uncharacterized protein T4A_6361 [Trichinella pseudospiralis]KRY87300.1 Uncharacterized protein T4D_8456 [Trichinella pseudospiralis]KRZ26176.1 Uncharacterized protein T4B_7297 [Trichinella pseudospiralis]KRZ36116.1 Uncharacterized protein T4C_326 [Trichinella pseudospiralis]